jgi:hypothetical protein
MAGASLRTHPRQKRRRIRLCQLRLKSALVLAHGDVGDDGERIAKQPPQRPEQHTDGNDREESDRWRQSHGASGYERHDQVAFDLLHHDEHRQRPGDRMLVLLRNESSVLSGRQA